jgi:hypothetical protein
MAVCAGGSSSRAEEVTMGDRMDDISKRNSPDSPDKKSGSTPGSSDRNKKQDSGFGGSPAPRKGDLGYGEPDVGDSGSSSGSIGGSKVGKEGGQADGSSRTSADKSSDFSKSKSPGTDGMGGSSGSSDSDL